MSYVKSFKRFRMEIDLRRWTWMPPQLPDGFFIEPWKPSLLDAHATAHYLSFRDSMDAALFSNFQTLRGCRRVVESIVQHSGFLPAATWLAVYHPAGTFHPEYVATMQGLIDHYGLGAIQNIGVVPKYQGLGLGGTVLKYCLRGYQLSGVSLAHLEVTAENEAAIHLYRKMGFQTVQVFYREPKRG